MNNPFVFGKVVRGSNFCNRKTEIQAIIKTVSSKNNLVIVSPRRYGKTSLVINALERNNIPFLFIDCSNLINENVFLERLTSTYLERLKKGDVLEKIKYLSKSVNIEYTFSVEGMSVKVAKYNDSSLDKLIKQISKDYVLVFDEFQELFVLDVNLVKRLRSVMQFVKQSFIFLGSRKHLLLYLFSNQKSPFYNFAQMINLTKISEPEWKAFIKAKCIKTKVRLTEDDIAAILKLSEAIPFYVQYLSYHFWEERIRDLSINPTEIIKKIISSNEYIYEELYSRLTESQRKALNILVKEEDKFFSERVLKEHNLKNPQLLNKALASLEEKGIIERNGRYQFNDPLFKQYLKFINQKV
ncbi:ATP-binding protein [Candidatus Woesearchaeota archaeon]|nr:ATP-binding protein [Candidatus Woesearchaeota archaeon]